jgi:hypothetical protein
VESSAVSRRSSASTALTPRQRQDLSRHLGVKASIVPCGRRAETILVASRAGRHCRSPIAALGRRCSWATVERHETALGGLWGPVARRQAHPTGVGTVRAAALLRARRALLGSDQDAARAAQRMAVDALLGRRGLFVASPCPPKLHLSIICSKRSAGPRLRRGCVPLCCDGLRGGD